MRGENNSVLYSDVLDQRAYLRNLVGGQAISGLVHYDQLRFMNDCLSDAYTLPVTARQVFDQPVAEMGYAAAVFSFFQRWLDSHSFHSPQLSGINEVFIYRQVQ